jgi:DNA-binding CsgD family transcriptional regulator
MDSENFDMAAQLFRDAAASADATGDAIASARAIDNLGVLLYARGNPAESLVHAERALDLYRAHGGLRGTCVALDHVGKCARSLGDLERAWQCHRESLEMRRDVGDARGIAVWLEAVASLLVSCGRYKGSARVLGAVDGIRERGRFPLYGNEMVEQRWAVRRTSDNLAPDVFARQWARGAGMTLEQAVEGAYAEAEASIAALRDVCRPPLPDIPAIYGLTRREIDVLRYLARRLTDKEIAEHLSISPRTVSTHVTVILAKLGVHSRRDAAKLADEAALK